VSSLTGIDENAKGIDLRRGLYALQPRMLMGDQRSFGVIEQRHLTNGMLVVSFRTCAGALHRILGVIGVTELQWEWPGAIPVRKTSSQPSGKHVYETEPT
jgi:hypothetical protein